MPLTEELIKQSEALADLPEEKVKAFMTLANNVFKEDIDIYAGTAKRRNEDDVKKLFGKDKPEPGMKDFEYLNWAWNEREKEFKAQIEDAKKATTSDPAEGEALKRKINQLETELKDAGMKGSELLKQDIEGYKQKLRDFESLEKQLKNDLVAERKKWEGELTQQQRKNLLLEIGFEKSQSLMGVEFNTAVPDSVRQDLIEARWQNILSRYTPEKVTTGNETVTQWRDKDGNIARNDKNNREPFTTKELLLDELKDILKVTRSANGAGTSAGGNSTPAGAIVDVTMARSQVEADEIIERAILAQGIAKGTQNFVEEKTRIRKENESLFKGTRALPLQ